MRTHTQLLDLYCTNSEEYKVMKDVVQRLPTVQLMPAPSEDMMISDLEIWRSNLPSDYRRDSCINGYGMISIERQLRNYTCCDFTGIVFNDIHSNNLRYTIRPPHEVEGFNDQSTWSTDEAQPRFLEPGPRFNPK